MTTYYIRIVECGDDQKIADHQHQFQAQHIDYAFAQISNIKAAFQNDGYGLVARLRSQVLIWANTAFLLQKLHKSTPHYVMILLYSEDGSPLFNSFDLRSMTINYLPEYDISDLYNALQTN